MTVPDVDTLATYGGAMQNYAPVEDPSTDRDASAANQSYASTAAMTHTAARSVIRFTAAATSLAMAIVSHDSVWGNSVAVVPVPARTSIGLFTITVPATITDDLGVLHTVALRGATCTPEGTVPYFCTASVSANVITVRIFTSGAALDNAAGVTFNLVAF